MCAHCGDVWLPTSQCLPQTVFHIELAVQKTEGYQKPFLGSFSLSERQITTWGRRQPAWFGFLLNLCLWSKQLSFNAFAFYVCSEWYGYHFPELIKIVSDSATYCKLTRFIGNRKELSEESLEPLEEITMDGAKAQAILEASRSSMGKMYAPPWLEISLVKSQVMMFS